MAKRILEDLKGEHYQIDFKHDEDESQLRKKIKLENDIIIDKIKEHYEDIDISEHEVHKFLLIFHTLMEAINSEENLEEADGVITDTFALIISKLSDLLRQNIDSLKLPAILKSALKKLKTYSTSKKQKKMPNVQLRPRRPVRPAGMGQKNNDQIRIRNRRYKIKRLIAQPKNVEVKRNGVVVRRMVVRRKAIFPSAKRRQDY